MRNQVGVAAVSIVAVIYMAKSNGFVGIWIALTIYMGLRAITGMGRYFILGPTGPLANCIPIVVDHAVFDSCEIMQDGNRNRTVEILAWTIIRRCIFLVFLRFWFLFLVFPHFVRKTFILFS